jgi:hypothetical protein
MLGAVDHTVGQLFSCTCERSYQREKKKKKKKKNKKGKRRKDFWNFFIGFLLM